MGFYEPEQGPPCAPSMHNFGPNGICWLCNHTRYDLINNAVILLKELDPNKLAVAELL